jgi:tape measure domain-containing protein
MAGAIIGGIAIEIVDDSARFTQSMNRNAALVEQQSQRMSRGLGGVAKSVDELNRKAGSFQPDAFRALSLSALRAQSSVDRLQKSVLALTALAGGGFGTALLVKNLTDTADRFTNIQNRIATVVAAGRERVDVEQQIFDVAQRTRSSYDETAKLFQRMSLASKTLGASQSQVLQVVETTQKALQAGGATGAEAASIATQLTQAFGSGNVAGDELRAIRENSTILAQAIADEFKVGVGELKKLGSEDQLPADRVFKAILKAGAAIDQQFAAMTPTFAQAMVVLDNGLTRYIGQVDKSLGVTNAMSQAVIALANNINSIGTAVAYAAPALAAVFANRVAQRAGGAIAAPFRAETAVRTEAVSEASAAREAALANAARAQGGLRDVQARVRANPEAFADPGILRAREQLRREIESETQALAAAEQKYRDVVKATAAPPNVASVARAPEFQAQRNAIRETQKELREAEAAAARATAAAAPDAAARVRAQERINASIEKEEALRRRVSGLAAETRARLPETISDPEQARVKGTSALLAAQERLQKQTQLTARLTQELAVAEQAEAQASIAATQRVEAAKLGRLQAEQALTTAAASRANTNAGRAIMEAEAGVVAASGRQQSAREAMGYAELAARQSAATNSSKALEQAQKGAANASDAFSAANANLAGRLDASGRAAIGLSVAGNLVKNAFTGVVAFLGGGFGALITAAAVGWGIYAVAQARATAAQEEFASATEGAIRVLERLQEASKSQSGVPAAVADANRTADALQTGLSTVVQGLMTQLPQLSNQLRGLVPTETQQRIIELQGKLSDVKRSGGDVSPVLQEIQRAVTDLAAMDPKFAGITGGLTDIVNKAIDAANRLREISQATAGAKMIGPPIPQDKLANELGDTPAEIKKAEENATKIRIDAAFEAERERKRLVGALSDADIKQAQDDKDRDKEFELRLRKTNEDFPTASPEERRRITQSQMSKIPKEKEKKAKETPEERLSERIARIREEAEVAFMPEADRAVVEEITKRKGGAEIAKRVRGDLQAGRPLTGEIADLRSALIAKEAAKEYANIVERYGDLAQVTPKIRDEQTKLNALLQAGKIDSMQYGLALADTMSKFQNFKWIDSLTDSLKGFGDTLADTLYDGKLNADTFAEAINSLGKALFKLALDTAALEPLKNLLRSGLATAFAPGGGGLAGLFGGGGGDAAFAGVTSAEIMHMGGISGLGSQRRTVPSALFRNAPRFHSGLRPGEMATILEKGENVLSRRQSSGLGAMMGGMANMQSGMQVVINEAPGTQAQVSQGEHGGLQVDILSLAEAGLADRMARGRGPLAKASRAGGRSNLRG